MKDYQRLPAILGRDRANMPPSRQSGRRFELLPQSMGTGLIPAKNWIMLANRCRYRVALMARELGRSVRWLQRQCLRQFGKTPRELLLHWRNRDVRSWARSKTPGKVMVERAGFAHFSSFSRSVARDLGRRLRQLRLRRSNRLSHKAKNSASTLARELEKRTPAGAVTGVSQRARRSRTSNAVRR